jgi:proteasome component ECM29
VLLTEELATSACTHHIAALQVRSLSLDMLTAAVRSAGPGPLAPLAPALVPGLLEALSGMEVRLGPARPVVAHLGKSRLPGVGWHALTAEALVHAAFASTLTALPLAASPLRRSKDARLNYLEQHATRIGGDEAAGALECAFCTQCRR